MPALDGAAHKRTVADMVARSVRAERHWRLML